MGTAVSCPEYMAFGAPINSKRSRSGKGGSGASGGNSNGEAEAGGTLLGLMLQAAVKSGCQWATRETRHAALESRGEARRGTSHPEIVLRSVAEHDAWASLMEDPQGWTQGVLPEWKVDRTVTISVPVAHDAYIAEDGWLAGAGKFLVEALERVKGFVRFAVAFLSEAFPC